MRPVSFFAHSTNSVSFTTLAASPESKFLLAEAELGYNPFSYLQALFTESPPANSPSLFRKPAMDSERTSSSNSTSENSSDTASLAKESHEQRLARIKAEIEAGVYETPEKLEIAIDRMFGTFVE